MADDYQNRKDIDNLYNLIWDSDNDRTQFVSREEFEEFKSHTDIIDLLGKSMDSSSYNLFTKADATFRALQSNLSELEDALMGDDENDGLIDELHSLQDQLYGGEGHDYAHATSDSLKGLLDALYLQLQAVGQGDTQLSTTLSALKSKLSGFVGTLQQFQNQIKTEVGQDVYDTFSQEILQIIYEIATSNTAIEEHKDLIDATNELIGEPTDSASNQGTPSNPVTVFGRLNDTSVVANNASDSSNEVIDILYRGNEEDGTYDENATPTEPANGTTMLLLNGAVESVGDVSEFTGATISTALKNSQNAIGDTSKFTGTDISSALKTGQDDIGNTTKFTGTDISTALQTAQGNIGNVNLFSGASISGALQSLQANIGTASFTGSDITTAIGSLQANIGDMNFTGSNISIALYNSQIAIGNTNLFEGNSISIALKNGQDDIQYVYDKHRDLLKAIINSLPVVGVVETENDKNDIDFFDYDYVYVKETQKFYKFEVQE